MATTAKTVKKQADLNRQTRRRIDGALAKAENLPI